MAITSVVGRANLVSLFPNHKTKKKIPISDPVFFTKDQLTIGSQLVYFGRHAPGKKWKVTRIWYFHLYKGQYRSHKATKITKLSDAVEVVCPDTGEIMELTFQYLSYSAIWRLA